MRRDKGMETEETEQRDKILGRGVYNESQQAHRDKRSKAQMTPETQTVFTCQFYTRFFFPLHTILYISITS